MGDLYWAELIVGRMNMNWSKVISPWFKFPSVSPNSFSRSKGDTTIDDSTKDEKLGIVFSNETCDSFIKHLKNKILKLIHHF